ncbi:FAST kinase domain-containing protein 3, mitochondrial-like [Schistocerca cancellata]|uniref:FAST kinase domain-containing protein 3, mitochondrial-like n=1 Tax=Schistocerca cancellata TaxID=274614 RepID=UPI0021180433|nr:FAST kinase domain-containing protein 3, mitochondrial-like [Schistocerca cancellata]
MARAITLALQLSSKSFVKSNFSCARCLTASVLRYSSKKNSELGQTTIIVQDGLDIQELPTIVRKVKDAEVLPSEDVSSESTASRIEDNHYEEDAKEVIDAFSRCSTKNGVYVLFETIPLDEKTSFVALQAFRRIVELENNQQFRNVSLYNEAPEVFTRDKAFEKIFQSIVSSPQADVLLASLKLLNRVKFLKNTTEYRDKLFNAALVCASDGNFDVLQICEIINVFASLKSKKDALCETDKLWTGLLEKEKDITENNIVEVYRILAHLDSSRNFVVKILEKRLAAVWWRLSGASVAEILSVFAETNLQPIRSLIILSRWTNTNIHVVTEDEILQIITGFCAVNYIDENLEKGLERYIKAKSLKIKNAAVMGAVMDYCVKFRFRNNFILHGCGEYFIKFGSELSPVLIKALFTPFGILDYDPPNGWKFWQVLENSVHSKFVQFRPEDIVDIMLSCVYLEKYPINFVKKIFNPYFLDRLHTTRSGMSLQVLRQNLVIFDIAMTLECLQYSGPLLPKDGSAKSLWQDGRIKRMINTIYDTIVDITGHPSRVSTLVLLNQLPVLDLYVIDILLHPSNMPASMLQFNLRQNRNLFVALLIHVPEHYCSDGVHLTGPQVMRKRHLKRLGLKVVSLKYNELARLKVHPKSLIEYIEDRMKNAEIPV